MENWKIGQMPNLSKELYDFSIKGHAKIVFRKCVKYGKLDWATKIEHKYGVQKDDTLVAFGTLLLTNKQKIL